MINNNDQLHQSMECIEQMYRALASLRKEVLPSSREQFALMAEGPLEQIRQIQAEIEDFTGVTELRTFQANDSTSSIHLEEIETSA